MIVVYITTRLPNGLMIYLLLYVDDVLIALNSKFDFKKLKIVSMLCLI